MCIVSKDRADREGDAERRDRVVDGAIVRWQRDPDIGNYRSWITPRGKVSPTKRRKRGRK